MMKRFKKKLSIVNLLKDILYLSLKNPGLLLTSFLALQVGFVSAFNRKTISNALTYLKNNRESINWEVNDSGFVRVRFPQEILDFNETPFSNTDVSTLRLRSNFWYRSNNEGIIDLADKAAHDHPNGFMTYVLNNGYTHQVYDVVSENRSAASCEESSNKNIEKGFCTLHRLFHKQNKSTDLLGTANLLKTSEEQIKPKDVVVFDDKSIHQILRFYANTLTLNVVRNDGDQVTNIYIPPSKLRDITETRPVLNQKESIEVTDSAIKLYKKALVELDSQYSTEENYHNESELSGAQFDYMAHTIP